MGYETKEQAWGAFKSALGDYIAESPTNNDATNLATIIEAGEVLLVAYKVLPDSSIAGLIERKVREGIRKEKEEKVSQDAASDSPVPRTLTLREMVAKQRIANKQIAAEKKEFTKRLVAKKRAVIEKLNAADQASSHPLLKTLIACVHAPSKYEEASEEKKTKNDTAIPLFEEAMSKDPRYGYVLHATIGGLCCTDVPDASYCEIALRHFTKAAEMGHPSAIFVMGQLYKYGKFRWQGEGVDFKVEKDPVQALEFFYRNADISNKRIDPVRMAVGSKKDNELRNLDNIRKAVAGIIARRVVEVLKEKGVNIFNIEKIREQFIAGVRGALVEECERNPKLTSIDRAEEGKNARSELVAQIVDNVKNKVVGKQGVRFSEIIEYAKEAVIAAPAAPDLDKQRPYQTTVSVSEPAPDLGEQRPYQTTVSVSEPAPDLGEQQPYQATGSVYYDNGDAFGERATERESLLGK